MFTGYAVKKYTVFIRPDSLFNSFFLPLRQSLLFSYLYTHHIIWVPENVPAHVSIFDRSRIKRFIRINQCYGYDRTFCFRCSFKTSAFKFLRMIAIFASGSLRQKSDSFFLPLLLSLTLMITCIDCLTSSRSIINAFMHANTCFRNGTFASFLLCHYRERYRADLHYGKHVIQSLVIRIKHKSILRRYIFYYHGRLYEDFLHD